MQPPDTTGRYKALVDISSVDVSQAWAVGYAGNGPLILRWNGTDWRRAAVPGPADTDLRAVASLPTGTSFMAGMVAFSDSFMLQRCT